jgi:competence protein ComEA
MAYGVVILALLVLVGRSVMGTDSTSGPAAPETTESLSLVSDELALEPEAEPVLVHVAGAVRKPGVYELEAGSRVTDAVERAGGPRVRAWLESINLAAQLVDGQQVLVPLRPGAASGSTRVGAGVPPLAPGASDGSPAGAATTGPISLSTASAAELEELPGVGPVTAEKIVAHRNEHGAFRSADELTAISGIGPARVDVIRDLVAP